MMSDPASAMRPSGDALWERWRGRGDVEARARLLDRYLGLVFHAARELKKRAARELELHDLVSAGTLGLVQALEGFDPGRGLAFSTYAVPRIRGAILDEMRSLDRMPRTVRSRKRRIAAAHARLQQRLGRTPTGPETARELGIDLPALWQWERDIDGRTTLPLDQPAGPCGGELRLCETVPDATVLEPDARLTHGESLDAMRAAFERLETRDRLVLTLYYYENLMLREIGAVLHITESRVSQIRTRALARLRRHMEEREQPSGSSAAEAGRARPGLRRAA